MENAKSANQKCRTDAQTDRQRNLVWKIPRVFLYSWLEVGIGRSASAIVRPPLLMRRVQKHSVCIFLTLQNFQLIRNLLCTSAVSTNQHIRLSILCVTAARRERSFSSSHFAEVVFLFISGVHSSSIYFTSTTIVPDWNSLYFYCCIFLIEYVISIKAGVVAN